jgi:hypothetical protein
MKYYGPMHNVSRIITTPQAGTLYWPKVNDTATAGSWHTEGGSVTVQDMTFTRETFGAHVLNTLVKVSVEWANDEFGLLIKPKANMNDYFHINIKDVNLKLVLHNVETFKKINEL